MESSIYNSLPEKTITNIIKKSIQETLVIDNANSINFTLLKINQLIQSEIKKNNEIVKRKTINFFSQNKNIIKSVYSVNIESGTIYYLIVLIENTLNNRTKFYDFIDACVDSKNVKIHFRFIDKELEHNITDYKEVITDF